MTVISLNPHGSSIEAGRYHLDLGEGSDSPPSTWQGPITIKKSDGTSCAVSDDVGIIEQPLNLINDHLLYVSTYSGSHKRLYVVDAENCAVKWASPTYFGKTHQIVGGRLILSGTGQDSGQPMQPLAIDPAGLPTK